MAKRTVTIQVFQRGKQDQLSPNPAELTVTNPPPQLPTNVTIEAVFDTIFFGYTPPTDLDWKGIQIWLSTNSGFNRNDQNKVYEGPDTLVPIGGLAANTTYYIRFAAFDGFGKDGIIVSSEFSVTTIEIIENQIADFAVTNAKIANLSADKIIAGNIVADDIFLGTGTEFKLDGPNKQIFVKDDQGSPVTRVKLGKLGANPEDFGLEVFDENGDLVIGADGLGLNVVGNLQLSTEVEERIRGPLFHVIDKKSAGTDGGTFLGGVGTVRVRDLNTILRNDFGVILAANIMTLDPGTYDIVASAPAFKVDGHEAFLIDINTANIILTGTSERTGSLDTVTTRSVIEGRFTLSVISELELGHIGVTTQNNNGFGPAVGGFDEIYSQVKIIQIIKGV